MDSMTRNNYQKKKKKLDEMKKIISSANVKEAEERIIKTKRRGAERGMKMNPGFSVLN